MDINGSAFAQMGKRQYRHEAPAEKCWQEVARAISRCKMQRNRAVAFIYNYYQSFLSRSQVRIGMMADNFHFFMVCLMKGKIVVWKVDF